MSAVAALLGDVGYVHLGGELDEILASDEELDAERLARASFL